jgi:hypothetical protein
LQLARAPYVVSGDGGRTEGILAVHELMGADDLAVLERKRVERAHEFLRRQDEWRRDVRPVPPARELRARLQILCAQAADECEARERHIRGTFKVRSVRDDGEQSGAEDVPEIADERIG